MNLPPPLKQNSLPESSPPLLGAHTSIAGGVYQAIYHGADIGADVIQIFSKNQMQWKGRDYSEEEIEEYFRAMEKTGVKPAMVHAGYLINLASPRETTYEKSFRAFVDELQRAQRLRVPYLVIHPGSHMDESEVKGIKKVATSLRRAMEVSRVEDVCILLESTAGQGTNLGYKFEHLRDIIDGSRLVECVGVCLDTCHIFAAGYEIRTKEGWQDTLERFDRIVGLEMLHGLHLNDSLRGLGSRIDRHRRIGAGELGVRTFTNILNHPRMRQLPMILEIPEGNEAYREDLRLLRSLLSKTSSK